MPLDPAISRTDSSADALQAYLLGTISVDALVALQRRLVYEVAGGGVPVVVVCDHPPGITIGREGSRSHIRPSPENLAARGWPVRWVSRGGGCMLHLPGQVAIYPIFPIRDIGLTPGLYIECLRRIAADLLREFQVEPDPLSESWGISVAHRRVAHIGVAVRDWISCFGMVVNVHPDLEPFREVHCDGHAIPMTSIQRESAMRVRVPTVRQRLLELIADRLGFSRVSVFHTHPTFFPKPTRHAIAPRSR